MTKQLRAEIDALRDEVAKLRRAFDAETKHRYTDINLRFNKSEDNLRAEIKDDAAVTQAVSNFKRLSAQNPLLVEQLQASADPYRFVYEIAAPLKLVSR